MRFPVWIRYGSRLTFFQKRQWMISGDLGSFVSGLDQDVTFIINWKSWTRIWWRFRLNIYWIIGFVYETNCTDLANWHFYTTSLNMFICTPRYVNTLRKQKSVVKREVGRAGGIQFEISLRSAVFFAFFFLHAHTMYRDWDKWKYGKRQRWSKMEQKELATQKESEMNGENIMRVRRGADGWIF